MNYGSKVQFMCSVSELKYFNLMIYRANTVKLILNSSIRLLLNSCRLSGTYVDKDKVAFTDKSSLIRLMIVASRCNES